MNMLEKYYNKRLGLLIGAPIEHIGASFPIVANIVSVLYVFNEKSKDKDVPEEHRLIRHLFRIIFADGSEILAGAKHLLEKDFPKSFVSNLEKIRRIIANDVATIEPLDEMNLCVAIKSTQTKIDQIISAKFYPGMLFLKDFGPIIEELFTNGCSLPAWVYANINKLQELACMHSEHAGQQNIEKYADIYKPLSEINQANFGRATVIVDILGKIKANRKLLIEDTKTATNIIRSFADKTPTEKDRTEKAFPFLWFLHKGIIPVGEKEKSFLESLWEQANMGKCLSTSQLDKFKEICKRPFYREKWEKLPIELKTSSAELIKQFEDLDGKIAITEDEIVKANRIRDTLWQRGINIDAHVHATKKGDLL